MSKLIDWYNTSASNLKEGDVLASVVICHINHINHSEEVIYIDCFRGQWPQDQETLQYSEGIPQGNDVGREESIALAKILYPIIGFLEYEVKVF